jgi:hypothetical protein
VATLVHRVYDVADLADELQSPQLFYSNGMEPAGERCIVESGLCRMGGGRMARQEAVRPAGAGRQGAVAVPVEAGLVVRSSRGRHPAAGQSLEGATSLNKDRYQDLMISAKSYAK